jgi:TPR repeat protein
MTRIAWCLCVLLCAGCAREAPPPVAEAAGPVRETETEAEAVPDEGRATLGVRLRDLAAAVKGALVYEVLAGGPADRAGLLTGDWVQAVDGARVESLCAYQTLLAKRMPGEDVTLSVRRGAETLTIVVRLGESLQVYRETCDQGEMLGCLLLGDFYKLKREGAPADRARARKLFEQACEVGLAEGCGSLGDWYFYGWGIPDDTLAFSFYQRACRLGNASGCASYAFLYATGQGVERDDARALDLYVRSCDGGDAMGCYNVGLMYQKGRGAAQAEGVALEAYTKGCTGGSPTACTNLGYIYHHGQEGVEPDPARAAELYERGCPEGTCPRWDPKSCVNLAVLYRRGLGVREDKVRTAELFQRGCDGGEADACANLGYMYGEAEGIEQDVPRSIELYQHACALASGLGCYNMGTAHEGGVGVEVDAEMAAEYYAKGCTAGDEPSCERAAELKAR